MREAQRSSARDGVGASVLRTNNGASKRNYLVESLGGVITNRPKPERTGIFFVC